MKFLNNYSKFFESSQSKKIRQYIGYSVVLKWYAENKEKIAKLLDVDASELADEDTLMKQSYDLVNSVINPQVGGNTGIIGTDIPGFEEFEKIENNLIHDILHNLFNVKYKEFNKSLSDIEFTESEIIEEIEVLAIEESFMKYMNISYPKTDFINANINQLASYLMMAILKNDPDRIRKILDKEEEPYLEVYGKKYPVKGTAFETFFDLFENRDADSSFKIKSSEDLKNYMIKLINVGEGISNSNGDRSQYPNGDYYGIMSWYDAPDSNKISWIKSNFEDLGRNDSSDFPTEWILIDDRDYKMKDWNFDYIVIGSGENVFKYEPNDKEQRKIYLEVLSTLIRLGFDENSIKNTESSMLQVFLNDIKWETREIKVEYLNKETNKKYRGYINIDNISNYLTPQLKLESLDFREEKFRNREELEAIPIRPRFIDLEKAYVKDFNSWFEYLEELVGENLVWKADDYKCIGIKKIEEEIENDEGDYETKFKYEIMSLEEFEDANGDDYNNNAEQYYPHDHEFINFADYEKMSFDEVVEKLFYDNDSMSIMRRNFRLGDIIKNNLSIGNLTGWRVTTQVVKTKNPAHKYLDFKGSSDPEKSISKEILTSNGKKLVELLNNFRGYVINNFAKIKADFKKNKAKFSEKDIKTFKTLDLNTLKKINDVNLDDLRLNFTIYLHSKNVSFYSNTLQELSNFFVNFEDSKKLADLIQNKDDIDYLKNFVNLRGSIKTTKDYYDFKKLLSSIGKKNIFKYKDLIDKLTDLLGKQTIKLNDELWKKIKDLHTQKAFKSDVDVNLPEVKDIVIKFLNLYLKDINWSDIHIKEFDSINLTFSVKINP